MFIFRSQLFIRFIFDDIRQNQTELSIGCIQKRNRSLSAQWVFAFDWPIFLAPMEYTNQIQELIERSVSGCASVCT